MTFPQRVFARLIWIVLGGLPFAPAFAGDAATNGEEGLAFGVEADVASRYVWRGLAYSHGAVLQPSANISAYDFTLVSWFNYDLGRKFNEVRFNEADLTLEWSKTWGRLTIEPSVQSFLYPSPVASPNTAEGVLRVGWELGPVTLFTRHSFDLAAYPGSYFGEIGLEWEWELQPRLSLETTIWLAGANDRFTEAYVNVPAGGFYGGGLEVSLRWQLANRFYLRPHAGVTVLGSERLRRQVEEPDLVWVGLAAGFEF
jgi:hypothetical protein